MQEDQRLNKNKAVKHEGDVKYIRSRKKFNLNSFPCNYNSIPIGSVVNSKICGETGNR